MRQVFTVLLIEYFIPIQKGGFKAKSWSYFDSLIRKNLFYYNLITCLFAKKTKKITVRTQ